MTDVRLEASWKRVLGDEFSKEYMQNLRRFLQGCKQQGIRVYPKGNAYFHAFAMTPFEQVKVVILGQDPYHGPGQAQGMSFSVPQGIAVPPSLQNIYKELTEDLGCVPPNHGYLGEWAQQGVLLLNSVLTVESHKAASHRNQGWEQFTDAAIAALNAQREHLVFMLWGSYAQKKGQFIDRQRHLVLNAPHPSPLSAYRGFMGCKHFSQANTYMQHHNITPVNWQLAAQ